MAKEKQNFWGWALKSLGWRGIPPKERVPKSIICAAPHTSNMDFIIGLLYYRSFGGDPHFVMKKELFFWPLGALFKSLGGFPVDRSKGGSLLTEVINQLNSKESFNIAVTPEGTRSYTERWKTGFYRMAVGAGVPIELARIDYGKKEVEIFEVFYPTGNMEADIETIRSKYTADMARYPEKFHDINK